MSRGLTTALVAWLGLVSAVAAAPVYVIDRLQMGVHEGKERDSAILELVATGTALEVVERQGDFLKVKTPKGNEGWVDADYVTEDPPAPRVLAELRAEHKRTASELAAARSEAEMLREALSARDKETPADGAELAHLHTENRELRETIASAEAQLAQLAQDRASSDKAASGTLARFKHMLRTLISEPWIGALVAAMFVIGFALGAYLLDYLQRRRHGGFRL